MAVTNFGATGLTLQPDWEITNGENGSTAVLRYKGAHADCLTSQPAYGANIVDANAAGITTAFYVATAKVTRLGGGEGLLEIAMTTESATSFNAIESGITYAVEFQQVNIPLEQSPYFAAYPGGIPDSQLALVEDALSERDPKKRDAIVLLLGAGAAKLYTKKRKGIDSFPTFSPVVTETQTLSAGFSTFGGNKRQNPPAASNYPQQDENGKPFVYLRMPDQKVRENGRWRKTRVWQGFHTLDSDLFP